MIHIKDILISSPTVTYELGSSGSNLDAMQKNVEEFTGGSKGGANLDFDRIAKMDQKGSAFQKALHKEYVRLARMEGDEFDWSDAGFFNDRAEGSAMGQKIGPQAIAARSLPGDKVKLMSATRAKLVKALAAGSAKRPVLAAQAQAGFDCWMQEQEENFQSDDIIDCRRAFTIAYNGLTKKAKKKAAPKKATPKRRAHRTRKPKPKPLPLYKINFGFNSAKLDGKAMGVIAKAAATIKSAKVKMAVINGHADRSGAKGYNQKLSNARASAVTKALTKAGVSGSLIKQRGYGETWMLVQTTDGKREAGNRRVDILLAR